MEWFTAPGQVNHRRYEALRAFCRRRADARPGGTSGSATPGGAWSTWSASVPGTATASRSPQPGKPGPARRGPRRPRTAPAVRVIALRRQGLSSYEITSATLATEGTPLNRTGVAEILTEEGFGRLLRHPQPAASITPATAGRDTALPRTGSIGLAGVMVAYFMMVMSLPIWLSIFLTLLLALGIGMYHGLFVTKLHMHGFLITLVTMGLARGAILVLTNAFPITGLPLQFNALGQGYLGDLIPIPVLIAAIVAALAFFVLRFTYIGRQIYAAGGNVEAASFSGVPVDRRIILCYVISVMCASIVGMIQAGRASAWGIRRRRRLRVAGDHGGHPGRGQLLRRAGRRGRHPHRCNPHRRPAG